MCWTEQLACNSVILMSDSIHSNFAKYVWPYLWAVSFGMEPTQHMRQIPKKSIAEKRAHCKKWRKEKWVRVEWIATRLSCKKRGKKFLHFLPAWSTQTPFQSCHAASAKSVWCVFFCKRTFLLNGSACDYKHFKRSSLVCVMCDVNGKWARVREPGTGRHINLRDRNPFALYWSKWGLEDWKGLEIYHVVIIPLGLQRCCEAGWEHDKTKLHFSTSHWRKSWFPV